MLSGKNFFQKRLHEYFLRKTCADVVGIDEDEITLVELMDAFEKKCALESVDGIAFLDSEENYIAIRPVTPYPIRGLFNIP